MFLSCYVTVTRVMYTGGTSYYSNSYDQNVFTISHAVSYLPVQKLLKIMLEINVKVVCSAELLVTSEYISPIPVNGFF